jgi:hypothetical protein
MVYIKCFAPFVILGMEKASSVTFFRAPKNDISWCRAIPRQYQKFSEKDYLFEKHFSLKISIALQVL